jgi:hypothetical protein
MGEPVSVAKLAAEHAVSRSVFHEERVDTSIASPVLGDAVPAMGLVHSYLSVLDSVRRARGRKGREEGKRTWPM